jgi:hypothetical protein
VCLLSAVACSSDDDPDGVIEQDPLGLGERGPGTCLEIDDEIGAEITVLPVVPCTVSHSHEIFAVENHPADVYPGFNELEVFAQRTCLAAFEPYVGSNPFDSRLFHTWLVPTLDGWNDEDDREIVCVLGSHDAEPLIGSVRNSGI